MLLNASDAAKSGDAKPYAAAKLAAEQVCAALASTAGATSFVTLRIGWCQPGAPPAPAPPAHADSRIGVDRPLCVALGAGANRPETLNPSGTPPQYQTKGAAAGDSPSSANSDELWFKNMWLSNGDFLRYFTAALRPDVGGVGAHLVVNAMSANSGMRWSLAETERALGVTAQDDAHR